MDYPLRIADQLTPHLKALRKKAGLTQAQLGLRLGVKQARVAEIEASPGVVSVEQMIQVLAALGADLVLLNRDAESRLMPPAAKGKEEGERTGQGAASECEDELGLASPDVVSPLAPPTGLGVRPTRGSW